MERDDEFKDIKIRLKGNDLEKFTRIKEKKGLLADAEVLRQLIKEADDALMKRVEAAPA